MDNLIGVWEDLEKFVGHEIPIFLKLLLWKAGYDNMISVHQICDKKIGELEKFIDNRKNQILREIMTELENFDSDDSISASISAYKNNADFEFLPGHRSILLSLSGHIQNMQLHYKYAYGGEKLIANEASNQPNYSIILTELIKTATTNMNKSKYAYQYTDVVKYFSTYIFLLCGRTCYETLNKNLPIPSTKTICKYLYFVDFIQYSKNIEIKF